MQRQLLLVHALVAYGADDLDAGVVHGVDAEVLALRLGSTVVLTVFEAPPVGCSWAASFGWVGFGFVRDH